ncbi:uncharacterized protein LOC125887568 isoform X2 [Epinephelus fuscoguttatus]|uniref:uncharacterized protein LOC125887568 isoform X2 n=1 Tax=Epinephelus fuscoguttatus TaxID=293821 RepID=UPI0020CFE8EB|nr:uncharacterized protein LOC125887568 isoform X2 [Epinephelus fuscoguttatus]
MDRYRAWSVEYLPEDPSTKVTSSLSIEATLSLTWKHRGGESVDGAKEDGSLCRLVNDDHKNSNSRMRLVEVDKKSHICLCAIQPISIGEEISYDYGGNDWPWRKKPAEVPPRTQRDSVVLDMVAVPSTESALNPPPATVGGVSSCSEPRDKKPAEGPPRTSPDSAFVDTVAVLMEQPTVSALNTPPATVGGVSSCPEPRDKKSVDKKVVEQTQTKWKTLGQHR